MPIAELSRPYHAFREKQHLKKKTLRAARRKTNTTKQLTIIGIHHSFGAGSSMQQSILLLGGE
jgi:hypothetical protein